MTFRSADTNPFRPGFGAVPEVWAGRDDALRIHAQERHARIRGRYTRGVVFVGPSGIGKSVLVNRFAQDSAALGDVVLDPVRIARRSDPIAQIAGVVTAAREHLAGDGLADVVERGLRRLRLISVKGVEWAMAEEGVGNPHVVLTESLIEVGELLARENATREPERRRALVLRVDELQNADNTQRSAILAAVGDLLERQTRVEVGDGAGTQASVHLPVLVFLTGLPDLLNRATTVDTFRRRFNTQTLGMLADADVADRLAHPLTDAEVTFDPRAVEYLTRLVAGDPYLFQLVGQHAWNASDGPVITEADVTRADRETYADRLRLVEAAMDDIPAGEMVVLRALYELLDDDLTVAGADVAHRLGKTQPEIAPAAQRLERRAVISRDWGRWRVENRLLHRYVTTGDILP